MDPIVDYRSTQSKSVALSRFMSRVYGWMTFGLLITAVVSYVMGNDPAIMQMVMANRGLFYLLLFVQLGLVFALSAGISRMSVGVVTFLFLLYSFITGIVFSTLFLQYSITSLGQTFGVTAGAFAGLALYGTVTKRDLSAMGSFMVMGLWGVMIALLVNFFLKSSALDFAVSALGVVIFSGLTAWDAQKIRNMGIAGDMDSDAGHKAAIYGALNLYLDFINLFIFLLRFLGGNRRRDY